VSEGGLSVGPGGVLVLGGRVVSAAEPWLEVAGGGKVSVTAAMVGLRAGERVDRLETVSVDLRARIIGPENRKTPRLRIKQAPRTRKTGHTGRGFGAGRGIGAAI
jgi:hypothetical protein